MPCNWRPFVPLSTSTSSCWPFLSSLVKVVCSSTLCIVSWESSTTLTSCLLSCILRIFVANVMSLMMRVQNSLYNWRTANDKAICCFSVYSWNFVCEWFVILLTCIIFVEVLKYWSILPEMKLKIFHILSKCM